MITRREFLKAGELALSAMLMPAILSTRKSVRPQSPAAGLNHLSLGLTSDPYHACSHSFFEGRKPTLQMAWEEWIRFQFIAKERERFVSGI